MLKHKRKRFLSIFITAVLVFTLALSSVMAQDDEHVRTDKLSVEGEDVEVMEGIASEDDVEIVEDEAIIADDAAVEEADADEAAEETEEELPAGEVTEEADADIPEAAEDDADVDAGIMTLSAGDAEDEDDYGIQKLAAGDVSLLNTSGSQVGTYETVSDAIAAAGTNYTVKLNNDITENVTMSSGTVTLDLNGKTLTADKAKNSTPTTVSVTGGTLTIMDSSGNNSGTITGGYANDGGGVELSGGAVVNFESGTISGNYATKSSSPNTAGGGVNFSGSGTFNMSGGVISGNYAPNGNGGGVCIDHSGVFNMSGGTISGNEAQSNGAAVYIYNGSFNMSAGTISGNKAGAHAGGINLMSGTSFTMSGGTITENEADDGAGVAVRGTSSFTMTGGTISGNNATGTYGGGVYVESSASFTMSGDAVISGNSAVNAGGGIYNLGKVTMESGKITGNSVTGTSSIGGGGVALNNSSATFTMNGGEISGTNTCAHSGGGVFIASGTFTMNEGSISGNSATANSYAGGGVCVAGSSSKLVMNGGYIKDNTSAGSAGGVQVYSSSSFEMNGGEISGNTATNSSRYAGGVEVYDGTSSFTLNGGVITNNTAPLGGGVYIRSTTCTFTVSGGAVSGNTRTDGTTKDDVYLINGAYITLGADLSSVPQTLTTYRAADQIGVITANDSTISESTSVRFTTIENTTDYYSTSNLYFFSDTGTATDGNSIGVRVNEDGEKYLELYEITPPVFESTYLMGDDNNLYTSATVDNYAQILAGASDWDLMDETDKATVNADLTAKYGSSLTYEDLLAQAQAIAEYADFEKEYLTGSDGALYTEATEDNYEQILSGAASWAEMSDEAKAQVNKDLQEASGDSSLTYDDLLAQAFQLQYLTDEDGDGPYVEATLDNYEQILAGADDWALMSDEAKAAVNAALQEASGDSSLTYDDLLLQAQALSAASDFIYSYVSDGDVDNPYLEATADNYEQILSGESDWDAMSEAEQAAVNAILTAAWQDAGNEGELTYPMLLAQAQAIADANAFEEAYLTGSDGELYTAATADNYEQILAGASEWASMSDEAKAQVNADLTEAYGSDLTYDDLLAQAFQLAYLTDDSGNGPYTEATLDNYEQILAGADDWALMSDDAKDAVNKALQEASGDDSLTYDDLLAQAQALSAASDFIYSYVSDSDVDNPYLEATVDNYEQILSGEDAWNAMSAEEQAAVNAILTEAWQAAGNEGELTYPMLLLQAKALDFEEKYLTDEDGNGPYTAATFDNMDQILAGADDWNAMSDEEKAAVNAALTAANGGEPLTYDELLAQAFILKYLTDEDGNLITEVNEGNYQKILSGAVDWNRLSPEAQALVNAYLTAAWQDAGNEGELTYPMLLEEAEAFAASLGNVKTGDTTHLYLYVILAAAAAAAAAGTAVYRRRRI